MNQYMVMLRGDYKEWNKYSPEESQKIIEKYTQWVQELRQKKCFKDGAPLKDGNYVISGKAGGIVVDGPFTESKEALTGYFIIEAENQEEIIKLAKGCPALTHGEEVLVFQLGH